MTAPDPQRIERARSLLAQGATEADGPGGLRALVLDGRVVMATTPATLRAAREPELEGVTAPMNSEHLPGNSGQLEGAPHG